MRHASLGRGKSVPIPGRRAHRQEILSRFSKHESHAYVATALGRRSTLTEEQYNWCVLYTRQPNYPCLGDSA